MAKTWITIHKYVDNTTGEYIDEINIDKNIIKKKIHENAKYKGKYNIRTITWLIDRAQKQLNIW